LNKALLKEKIRLELERGAESLKGAEVNLKEGLFDESVSSAYYAMFHSIKAILLTIDQEPATHQGVVTLFGLHFIKPGIIEEEYNSLFIEAKDDREDSDYDVTRKFARGEAEERIASAKILTARIADYLKRNSFLQ
jgi:uncharacterized protein (UPF0332 family)